MEVFYTVTGIEDWPIELVGEKDWQEYKSGRKFPTKASAIAFAQQLKILLKLYNSFQLRGNIVKVVRHPDGEVVYRATC